jgi:hypothetical protein
MMSSNIITADRILTIRCKAFSGQGVREHRVMVDADRVDGQTVTRGRVRVWDDVAGHFTVCHSLSESAIRRIRRTFQPE